MEASLEVSQTIGLLIDIATCGGCWGTPVPLFEEILKPQLKGDDLPIPPSPDKLVPTVVYWKFVACKAFPARSRTRSWDSSEQQDVVCVFLPSWLKTICMHEYIRIVVLIITYIEYKHISIICTHGQNIDGDVWTLCSTVQWMKALRSLASLTIMTLITCQTQQWRPYIIP